MKYCHQLGHLRGLIEGKTPQAHSISGFPRSCLVIHWFCKSALFLHTSLLQVLPSRGICSDLAGSHLVCWPCWLQSSCSKLTQDFTAWISPGDCRSPLTLKFARAFEFSELPLSGKAVNGLGRCDIHFPVALTIGWERWRTRFYFHLSLLEGRRLALNNSTPWR